MIRRQKERDEQDRLKLIDDKKREKEEGDALERARQQQEDMEKKRRELERRKEQERRKRQAVCILRFPFHLDKRSLFLHLFHNVLSFFTTTTPY